MGKGVAKSPVRRKTPVEGVDSLWNVVAGGALECVKLLSWQHFRVHNHLNRIYARCCWRLTISGSRHRHKIEADYDYGADYRYDGMAWFCVHLTSAPRTSATVPPMPNQIV